LSDFKGMTLPEAMKYSTSDSSRINSLWICDDDGDIGNFSNEIIRAKVDSRDFGFFENEYVRFLARVEGLSLGFIKGESRSYNSEIDYALIHRVCELVQDMPSAKKRSMFDNLQAYRVDLFSHGKLSMTE
jgi:hypothetical protein